MKYRIYFRSTLGSSVEVEAEDPSEAIDKAHEEFPHPQICGQCSGWGKEFYIDQGEWEAEEEINELS